MRLMILLLLSFTEGRSELLKVHTGTSRSQRLMILLLRKLLSMHYIVERKRKCIRLYLSRIKMLKGSKLNKHNKSTDYSYVKPWPSKSLCVCQYLFKGLVFQGVVIMFIHLAVFCISILDSSELCYNAITLDAMTNLCA